MANATPQITNLEKFKKDLEYIIRASFACIWVRTHEEERAIKAINAVVKKLEAEEAALTKKPKLGELLYVWDCKGEIIQYVEEDEDKEGSHRKCEEPHEVFPVFASNVFPEKSALIVLDFNFFFGDNALLLRSIRNTLNVLKRDGKIVIFVAPRLAFPEEIEKEISVIPFPLPGREELKSYLNFVVKSASKGKNADEVSDDTKEKLIDAALGLTSQEAEDAFSLAIVKNIKLNGDSVKTVLEQKVQILRKDGVLEYIKPIHKMEDIGGLENLKGWLSKRRKAFGKKAREFGLPSPRGILLVGISGCGKSLTAKACASNWELGIYRLDVGKIFTKLMGESESNARKVIEVAEAVAPCILWIDEIEKGMAGSKASGELDSGVTARVIGTLLTWMQEKEAPVFVVATANDVTKLPPELLRKGRFDEIFFVDLPNPEERAEIIKIQLKHRNRTLTDIQPIIEKSDGYTGAEIEQAIVASLHECYDDGERALTTEDVVQQLKLFVPLAETMKEDVDFLKQWGGTRARPASGKPVPSILKGMKPKGDGASFLRNVRAENKDVVKPVAKTAE
jgi:SpoVK/Ycf46/Vps4 family AAA+-type ATPase